MSELLNEIEAGTLIELSDLWMKANEEILNTVLNRGIQISAPKIIDKPQGEETNLLKGNSFLAFPLTVTSGILGNFYLVFSKEDLAIITDLIIGGDGSSPMKEFDELHLSVLEEAINQIAGTLESILSDNVCRKINTRLGKPESTLKNLFKTWQMVCLEYEMKIEGLADSRFEILIPLDFSKELIEQLQDNASCKINYLNSAQQNQYPSFAHEEDQGGTSMYRKAIFQQLDESVGEKKETKLDLIMDIPLELTVVLGKTHINVKDLVDLAPGSVIELEKLAGEPVDIFVNERLVGVGEVIVIEENFGIRVIDIVDRSETVSTGGGKRR